MVLVNPALDCNAGSSSRGTSKLQQLLLGRLTPMLLLCPLL
jgi:hypothetical protein